MNAASRTTPFSSRALAWIAMMLSTVAPVLAAAAETKPRVYAETDVDKSPLLLEHTVPKPQLTPGQIASITVSWTVTTEGVVEDPKVVASASPEIDAVVLSTVKGWRYEPGQKKGKAVPVRVLRKYTFGQHAKD